MRKSIVYGLIIGIISSFIIGFYLKWVEKYFQQKVYTLLLNIEYLPILKHYHFSEMIDFLFHTIVSIIIVIILIIVIYKYRWTNRQIFIRTILISLFIGVLIYPTTIFSEKTPEMTSLLAISHWLIGHLLYGIALSLGFIFVKQRYSL